MDDKQQSLWRTRGKRVLWIVGIIVGIVGAYIFLRFAYVQEWKWTGLVKDSSFHKRTLWDWLNLLIVPAVLAIGGYLFTRSETRSTEAAAERRARDEALQTYLDQMANMLIPDKDSPSLYKARLGDSLSTVARARTLTVLSRLGRDHKARVVQFLYQSGLIIRGDRQVLGLREANLEWTRLSKADLRKINLSGAYLLSADLREVDLREADLSEAYLWHADLRGAKLKEAFVSGARMVKADLRRADLRGADLRGADLRGANLRRVYLSETLLEGAVLEGAKLSGATMPNGQKYEDWLKDK